MKRAILGALALVLTVVAVPAYAAAASASVFGISGVLYDDCRPYPYGYSVTRPGGAGYWALDVVVLDRFGRRAATDYVAQPGSTGRSNVVLCAGVNPYGGYTIRATLEWGVDEQHVDQSAALAPAAFSMRKPYTRTALSVSTRRPAYGQVVRYRISVWDERPDGYHPTAFAWVILQKRIDGHWVRIRDSRTLTHSTGRVALRLKYLHHHKRMRIRAVTQAADRYARSASTPIRLW